MKKDYKILMITINNAWRHGNIGIDQLSGYLRTKGFKVDIKYFRTRDAIDNIFKRIKGQYNFYGFSVTSANYSMCVNLAHLIKEYDENAIIDFGGGFVTRYYREVLSETEDIDYITLGDGEIPTEFLLEKIINDSSYINSDLTEHYAVASHKDTNGKHQYLNMEISHYPAYDYYENDTYVRNSRKVHCIQTKNNICTGNCSFCTERHGKVHYKDINHIIEEIKYVYDNFDIRKIFFTDDNIFDPNDNSGRMHVRKLCEELLKLKDNGYNIVYQCYIKAISIQDDSEGHALLEMMKDVGFVEVFVGIESGDNDDLALYNKYTKVSDNYTIIRMLKQHELFPIMGFIAFNPYTTFEKLENNFKFLCDVECTYLPNYLYSFVNINKYTEIYNYTKRDHLMLSSDAEYINIRYKYLDEKVSPILNYIENNMIKRLSEIQYETDWIIFSYMEHQILYEIDDFKNELLSIKNNDFIVIKKYLSLLFIDHNLNAFKAVENKFWNHFIAQQAKIKKIYSYLIDQHKVSDYIVRYAEKCGYNRLCESRKCNDIVAGKYVNGKPDFWFEYEKRLAHKDELEIKGTSLAEQKTIVIVLESPHIAEYSKEFISPALGTTGENLQKYFHCFLRKMKLTKGNYRIILMNSIQYQCSLGQKTGVYRDNMWLKLWYKENLKEDFILRLKSYSPDIVINMCTLGDHKSQEDAPVGCKTIMNKEYINHCIYPLKTTYKKKTTLRQIVSDTVISANLKIDLYECNHPSSWKRNSKKINNSLKKIL